MFVTSIDVEEGMTSLRKNKKKKKKVEYQEQDGSGLQRKEAWLDPESFYADSQPAATEPQINASAKGDATPNQNPSYAQAEQTWSGYRKVENWEDLGVGCIVGWQVSIGCIIFCACFVNLFAVHVFPSSSLTRSSFFLHDYRTRSNYPYRRL
jgi:hypothetical protein